MRFSRDVNINKPFSFSDFCNGLEEAIGKFHTKEHSEIVIVCIGTDRATGDCLGPLVGSKIKDMKYKNVHIFGTLDEPVHAKNLSEYLYKIDSMKNPFVIAVDACLGRIERIGTINIGDGPLYPGDGVNKQLPPVGTINIKGIVNVGGFMELMILQNTRLSVVMNIANVIANGLKYVMWKLHQTREEQEILSQMATTDEDSIWAK